MKKLLKLVIVDDEPILLQGLLQTYDWEEMGFKVVGTAQSGEQAIEVIKEQKPHVVLTDIRMKKITGLMVIDEIKKAGIECLFVVLSAYRDFNYAQQACELGAFAYLLKPIEDEKLQETMGNAYQACVHQLESVEKLENWEKMDLYNEMLKHNVKSWAMPNGTKLTRVDEVPAGTKTVAELDVEAFKAECPATFERYCRMVEKKTAGKAGYVRITVK